MPLRRETGAKERLMRTLQTLSRRRALALVMSTTGYATMSRLSRAFAEEEVQDSVPIDGRLIAIGISGASAVAPVGTFLPGGPIHDNPTLAAFTQPGRVLDPARILIGSRSNFGAPITSDVGRPGAFLSIDPPSPHVLGLPEDFAASGDQASAL